MLDTFLTDLQNAIECRLNTMDFFSMVQIYSDQKAAVDDAINNALKGFLPKGGKGGIAVKVMMPKVKSDISEVPAGAQLMVVAQCEVVENELFNRNPGSGTELTFDQVATQVYQAMKGFELGRADMAGPLTEASNPIQPVPKDDGFNHMLVTCECLWALDFDPKVATPVPSDDADQLSLATATEGAEVWYTTDGSFAWPGNPTATLYTVPIAITAPTTVRASAYKAGCVPSNEWSMLITPQVVDVVDTDNNQVVDTSGNDVIEAGS